MYGINLVKTKYDNSVRRGAIVKALCLFSKHQFVEAMKIPLDIALESYFLDPRVEVLEALYTSINSIDISALPRPNLLEHCLMRRGVCFDTISKPVDQTNVAYYHMPAAWTCSLPFALGGRPDGQDGKDKTGIISIPVYRSPDEIGDVNVTYLYILYSLYSL